MVGLTICEDHDEAKKWRGKSFKALVYLIELLIRSNRVLLEGFKKEKSF